MNHDRSLSFVWPGIGNEDGENLDFISTTNIQIPKGSQVALQSARFTPRTTQPISGQFNLRLNNLQTPTAAFTEVDPRDPNALQSMCDDINKLWRFTVSNELEDSAVFNQLLGSDYVFRPKGGKLIFVAVQSFFFSVNDVLVRFPASTELGLENVSADLTPNAGGDVIQLDLNALKGAVQSRLELQTDAGCARFGTSQDALSITAGFHSLSFYSVPGPNTRSGGDVPLLTIRHNYHTADTVASPIGIKKGMPSLIITDPNGQKVGFSTVNGSVYEVRRSGRTLVILRFIPNQFTPPKDRFNQDIVNFQSEVVTTVLLADEGARLFPRWDLFTTQAKAKAGDRKKMTQCFYTGVGSTLAYDPLNRLAVAPAAVRFDNNLELSEQAFDSQGIISNFRLRVDDILSDVLGLADSVLRKTNLGPTGFAFSMEAPNSFGAKAVRIPNFRLDLLEPFRLSGFRIFKVGEGNTVHSSVLALFQSTNEASEEGEVLYIPNPPQYYPISASGDINARSFRFKLSNANGERLALENSLELVLLIRSPTPLHV